MKYFFKRILDCFLFFLIVCFTIAFGYSIIYRIFGWYKTEYIFNSNNMSIIQVKDNIMEPELKKDDIIIVQKNKTTDIQKGEIVYFENNNLKSLGKVEDKLKTQEGKEYYIIKGNQNYYAEDIVPEQIEGSFKQKINFVFPIYIIISNEFSIVVIVILILSIFILERNKIKSVKRKMKRENESP